jgi:hypothetical protein
MKNLLRRIDAFSPRSLPKLRIYTDQLSQHATATKEMSRSDIDCVALKPEMCDLIREEMARLSPSASDGLQLFRSKSEEYSDSESEEDYRSRLSIIDSESGSEHMHSDDSHGLSPHSRLSRARAASTISSPRSPTSMFGSLRSRRHTVSSGDKTKSYNDRLLVDPIPGLVEGLDAIDKMEIELQALSNKHKAILETTHKDCQDFVQELNDLASRKSGEGKEVFALQESSAIR